MNKAVEVSGLFKSYGEVQAVRGIDFTVDEGSLFAFLGINGAGKSTTINIICSLLKKDAGKVKIFGCDLDGEAEKIRAMIGVIFQGSVLDKRLSVKDNLSVRASFYGLTKSVWKSRLEELTELLDLGDILSRPYMKLSGGQRRRADVARGLINSPRMLILDEPTTGLDPQTRKTVWNVIDRLREEKGMTVFLTTHYMEEANEADKVVIIDEGRIVAADTPVGLKNAYSYDYVKIYGEPNALLESSLENKDFIFENNCYRVRVDGGAEAKKLINGCGNLIDDFEVVKGNMDDVFLNVTGKNLLGEA